MLQVIICVGSSCHLKGSYSIIEVFNNLIKKHGLEKKIELKASFCLGRCTKGVSVKINEDFIDDINLKNAEEKFNKYILEKFKNEYYSI